MANRRKLDRERLEIFFYQLFLAYRPFIQISGLLLLIYAIAALLVSPMVGSVALGLALLLILISASDQAALLLVKIGAWIGTVWRPED